MMLETKHDLWSKVFIKGLEKEGTIKGFVIDGNNLYYVIQYWAEETLQELQVMEWEIGN